MWIDATVAASFVTADPKDSTVADNVGFALAPPDEWRWKASARTGSGRGRWPFLPALSKKRRPSSSSNGRQAQATSSWLPPTKGGRTYLRAHGHRFMKHLSIRRFRFAQMTLDSINAADPTNPTVDPVPLCWHPICCDPGICWHGNRSKPGILCRLRWTANHRRSVGESSGYHQRNNGSCWLPLSSSISGGDDSFAPCPPHDFLTHL